MDRSDGNMFEDEYGEMVTVDDLCEMLSIGRCAAYKLLSSGELHAFKIGRIWKIPRDSVAEYILNKSGLGENGLNVRHVIK